MNELTYLFDILLVVGIILFFAGTFFFFVPGLIIKWNSIGNTWLGKSQEAVNHARIGKRLFSADYAIFSNHRITGGIMWGFSSIFLLIYIFYLSRG